MCLGGSLAKLQICFGRVFRITTAVTGPERSITTAVTGFSGAQYYSSCYGFGTRNNPAAFTTYINYVSLRRVAVKYRFRVWLYFILPLIDPAGMAWDGNFHFGASMYLFYLYCYG